MSEFKVLTGTWNVNATSPKKGKSDLSEWLCKCETPPAIVAVALQEIVPLTAVKNYVASGQSNKAMEEWRHMIGQTLKDHKSFRNVSYQTLEVHNLVGMMMVVQVQSHLFNRISNVRVGNSVGRKGLGNKGAVSIRMDIALDRETKKSMCFVGCHLTAHMDKVKERNQDLDAIMKRTMWNKLIPGDHSSLPRHRLSIPNHDIVFLIGDFNYRLADISADRVQEIVKHGQYNTSQYTDLVDKHDQLARECRKGINQLHGFKEGKIEFPPTFKFHVGTNIYKTKKGNKTRVPSYCDRILYKSNINIQQLSYYSATDIVDSDHKPVAAEFSFPEFSYNGSLLRSLSERKSDVISASPGNSQGTVLVLCVSSQEDYEPSDSLKLSLRKDDRIEVISDDMLSTDGTNGWHVGRSKRTKQIGYFNSHFCNMLGIVKTQLGDNDFRAVEKLRALNHYRSLEETGSQLSNPSVGSTRSRKMNKRMGKVFGVSRNSDKKMKATRSYNAEDENELSVKKGDLVRILSRHIDNSLWIYGSTNDGREGLVPSACFTF